MARVTVEDCVDKVDNRFELVILAAQRAREIELGSPLAVDRDRDKNTVVALREIAEEKLNIDNLRESVIKRHQRVNTGEEQPDNTANDVLDEDYMNEEQLLMQLRSELKDSRIFSAEEAESDDEDADFGDEDEE